MPAVDDASIVFVGGGRFVREVIPLVAEEGWNMIGILDDQHASLPSRVGGLQVLGPVKAIAKFPSVHLVVAVASSTARRDVVRGLRAMGVEAHRFRSIVDPTVRNPSRSRIGPGSIYFGGVTITVDVELGEHVVAMPGVTITHDCVVGDFVTFAAGVSLGGGCVVGEAAYLGMNASVRQEVVIGSEATIGMGAVVLQNVPTGQTWAGVPARERRAREART